MMLWQLGLFQCYGFVPNAEVSIRILSMNVLLVMMLVPTVETQRFYQVLILLKQNTLK